MVILMFYVLIHDAVLKKPNILIRFSFAPLTMCQNSYYESYREIGSCGCICCNGVLMCGNLLSITTALFYYKEIILAIDKPR